MKFPAFEPINLKNNSQTLNAVYLSLEQIKPNENQPRKNFDNNSLEELTLSIKKHGIIQPIIVRNINNSEEYQIIAGERRWRAAKKAGLKEIPAIIRESDKLDRLAVALIENIQRENLNSLEEAQAIQKLLEEFSMTHNQVAESIGRSRATVSNLLRILTLTNEVKLMIKAGLLEMGHARALVTLVGEKQIETAKLVIEKSLSVRKTEELVHRVNNLKEEQKIFLSSEVEQKIMEWKKRLSKEMSSKVGVQFSSKGKGKIVIHFDSVDEADWLMDHIKF
jgi:ParB family chromosome partitioning protein